MISTNQTVARSLAHVVPASVRAGARHLWCWAETGRARRRWEDAAPTGALSSALIPAFAERYPVMPSLYTYSPDDLLARGLGRCEQLTPYVRAGGTTLEIGSADAMTACALTRSGCAATAIDIDISRTDPRALASGVRVLEMDATHLDLPDAAFDLVYSFNVLEHLPDPAATIVEVMRVLRPGGVAFLTFTGLRWSPHGAHLYKFIGVPYVTVLFEEAAVLEYLHTAGFVERPPWVNEYSIEGFRAAFQAQAHACATFRYTETRNRWHADVVADYAGVFKARAPSFDSLMVSSIRAVLTKRS